MCVCGADPARLWPSSWVAILRPPTGPRGNRQRMNQEGRGLVDCRPHIPGPLQVWFVLNHHYYSSGYSTSLSRRVVFKDSDDRSLSFEEPSLINIAPFLYMLIPCVRFKITCVPKLLSYLEGSSSVCPHTKGAISWWLSLNCVNQVTQTTTSEGTYNLWLFVNLLWVMGCGSLYWS